MKRGIFLMLIVSIGGCFSSSIQETQAKKLAEELFNHPEIKEIDDCSMSKKNLNGIRISIKEDEGIGKERYYKDVLAEEGIKEADFEYFKKRLTETGLRHYYKKDNYSVFATGGMFGDIEGILVVLNNDTIPKDGFRLNEYYYIWIGNEIEKNVYRISGA